MILSNRTNLATSLREVGLAPGQTVFLTSTSTLPGDAFAWLLTEVKEGLGPEGTLCAPAYTHSFFRGEVFDPQSTPAPESGFGEWLRQQDDALRSNDPLYSIVALGARAGELTSGPPGETLGKDSFWHRFLEAEGVLLGLDSWLPPQLIHHLEWKLKVPYRYNKLFTGKIITPVGEKKAGAVYFGRDLADPGLVADLEPFIILADEFELVRKVRLDGGELFMAEAGQLLDLARESLQADPWFLVEREESPAPADRPEPHIPLAPPASMQDIIKTLGPVPRHLMGDEYDGALSALGGQLPMEVHEYPTGSEAFSWIVPEAWACEEARLETLSGQTILSTNDHPLHVVSYSLPFEGEVTREELFAHLHTHRLPSAIPFVFKYYERDWGLCCSQEQKQRLTDEAYQVTIQSRFYPGSLKVGEIKARGKSPKSFVLCAHLDHPCQVNDGLSGVAVGMEVMRRLRDRQDLNYTYRLLVLPETIGSLCWLSHNQELIPDLGGGLFLEMLGLNQPHALQLSFVGDSALDDLFTQVMEEKDPQAWTGPFRGVIGNDERQFNAPGVRIPMLSLSRCLDMDHVNYPYPAYHSSLDNFAACAMASLEESLNLVLAMIQALEEKHLLDEPLVLPRTPGADGSPIPKPLYGGEVFCSRYGLHVDWYSDPQGNRKLFDVLALIDGEHSQDEIVSKSGASPDIVQAIMDDLAEHGLIAY